MRAAWFSSEASVPGGRERCPHTARGEFPGKPAWYIAMAIVNLALFSWNSCQGVTLKFEGELERCFRSEGTPKVFLFEGATSESKWILKIYEEGRKQQFGHYEYGFDETNQFTLEYVNQEPFHIAVAKPRYIFINGDVRPRTIPYNSYTHLHVYWLAFRCCVYANERVPQLPSKFVYHGLELSNSIKTVYVYAVSNANEVVIDEILFLNPGLYYTSKGLGVPYPPPYDKGFVDARFKVLERQKIASLVIPTLFEWRIYEPRSGGSSSNDLDVVYWVRGKVTKLLAVEEDFSAVPEAPNNLEMVVTDYRIQEQSGVSGAWYISRGRFLKPDEAEFQKHVNRIRASPAPPSRNPAVGRVIVVGFLIVSFCAALLLLKMRRCS